MIYFFGFIFLLIAQRLFELRIAKRHEEKLRKLGASEVDKNGYRVIVGMHSAFFVSLVLEEVFLNRGVSPEWPVFLTIFVAAQLLRYWAIHSLGAFWNTKIIVAPNHPIVRKGPYRYLRHPNYVAVITEFVVIPLLFACYLTAAIFSAMNALLLARRIKVEARSLASTGHEDQSASTSL